MQKLAGIEEMVGLFINTLPLRTRSGPHERAVDLLKRTERELRLRQNYEHSSLVNIRKWSETGKGQELFDTLVILENYPLENLYGPTEATVYASWYSLADWNGRNSIPIGKPLPNDRSQKFSANDQCPMTNDRSQPHHSTTHQSPITIYHTGDLARWLPDGNIEFLGRMDDQVKVRGFRIELGEIQSCILSHRDVKKSVVTAEPDKTGQNVICAYVVPARKNSVEVSKLRNDLLQKLPAYMVPSHFVMLEKIPLTPTGKIDRNSLPEPGIVSTKKYIAPGDDIEKVLADIWSRVLGIDKEKIGIHDNFFEIGGHSLKAAALIALIHKRLNVIVPLPRLFKTQYIRGLAVYIKEAAREKQDLSRIFNDTYIELSSYINENLVSRFDLLMGGKETDETIRMHLYFLTVLYKKTSAEKIVDRFREILAQVIADSSIKLKDLRIGSNLAAVNPRIFAEEQMEDFDF